MTHTIASLQDNSPSELNVICAELCGVRRCSYLILLCWPDAESSNVWSSGCYDTLEKATTAADELVRNGRVLKEIKSIPLELPPYATSYDAIMPEIVKLDGGTRFDFMETVTKIRYNKSGSIYTFAWSVLTASPADLTRALILTKQTNEETKWEIMTT